MKLRDFDIRTALVLAGFAAIGGVLAAILVVALGLYDVSARKGHWPGVSWLLHTTFENSAALRAPPPSVVPDNLDTPDMIALGAGHFMSACAGCHGAPGVTRSATTRRMVPVPPPLTDVRSHFDAPELFWIVKHGIKMSGMPYWPASRDDDIWPVVAFLRAIGDIEPDAYRALTDTSRGGSCAVCHGADGVSTNRHVPRLDILSREYIKRSLDAYRAGTRDSAIMHQAISTVPGGAIPRLAERFARVAPKGAPDTRTPTTDAGRDLAFASGRSQSVPACRACHGPWPEPLNPAFPSLAGQHAPYLKQQLELWRDGNRGGGRAAELMFRAARDLTDDDIAALAQYYAGLKPARLDAVSDLN